MLQPQEEASCENTQLHLIQTSSQECYADELRLQSFLFIILRLLRLDNCSVFDGLASITFSVEELTSAGMGFHMFRYDRVSRERMGFSLLTIRDGKRYQISVCKLRLFGTGFLRSC